MENTIAKQNRIMRYTKLLFLAESDREKRELLTQVFTAAKDTRDEYIAKMRELQGKDID
ncbi:hypothetical protein KC887_08725 [Candidatus Kaiserbacteria bacterium]|nr:hypothetical protein [Candidatus Kaiserbacteria bacterium]